MKTDTAMSEAAISLAELRRRLGRSQASIATAVGTTQSGVSRLEHQPDMRVSTLAEYVHALGGRLRIVVDHPAGHAEIKIPSLSTQRPADQRREYRVIWQDPRTRGLVHVGWLEYTGDEFVFSYTADASSHPRFKPFPSFPVLEDSYRSGELFPFFSVRLTSTTDPQYDAVLDALGLTREAATPAELLARSPSESPHDTIQVVPEPVETADGTLVRTFLASGVRHLDQQTPEAVERLIHNLEVGTPLELVPEPDNPVNPDALQLAVGGQAVGWVPNYLVDEIHDYIRSNRPLSFTVARANGPDTPWHLRLLCRLTAGPSQ